LITETASEKLNVPQALSSFLLVIAMILELFVLVFFSVISATGQWKTTFNGYTNENDISSIGSLNATANKNT
jgi:hypothetical protein